MADLLRRPVTVFTIKSHLGALHVGLTSRGIAGLEFGRIAGVNSKSTHPQIRYLTQDLQRYSSGRPVHFKLPLDLTCGTPFQQKVWRALCKIPRGQTRSYAWIARQIGQPKAARAVGAACGANPIPIIVPCHRVIASDGSLGGYSGGLERKRQLLKLEGNRI